jgi:hypothetical protein
MSLRTDDLVIPQGATWEIHWPVLNLDGTPTDLTTWGVRAQVRTNVSADTVLYEWNSAAANVSLLAGEVVLSVPASDSSAWPWTDGVYDVELFQSDGTVIRLTQGHIKVSKEVTR